MANGRRARKTSAQPTKPAKSASSQPGKKKKNETKKEKIVKDEKKSEQTSEKARKPKSGSAAKKKRSQNEVYKSRHKIGQRSAAGRVGSYRESEVAFYSPDSFWPAVKVDFTPPSKSPETAGDKPSTSSHVPSKDSSSPGNSGVNKTVKVEKKVAEKEPSTNKEKQKKKETKSSQSKSPKKEQDDAQVKAEPVSVKQAKTPSTPPKSKNQPAADKTSKPLSEAASPTVSPGDKKKMAKPTKGKAEKVEPEVKNPKSSMKAKKPTSPPKKVQKGKEKKPQKKLTRMQISKLQDTKQDAPSSDDEGEKTDDETDVDSSHEEADKAVSSKTKVSVGSAAKSSQKKAPVNTKPAKSKTEAKSKAAEEVEKDVDSVSDDKMETSEETDLESSEEESDKDSNNKGKASTKKSNQKKSGPKVVGKRGKRNNNKSKVVKKAEVRPRAPRIKRTACLVSTAITSLMLENDEPPLKKRKEDVFIKHDYDMETDDADSETTSESGSNSSATSSDFEFNPPRRASPKNTEKASQGKKNVGGRPKQKQKAKSGVRGKPGPKKSIFSKKKKKKKSIKVKIEEDIPLWPPPRRLASLNAQAILSASNTYWPSMKKPPTSPRPKRNSLSPRPKSEEKKLKKQMEEKESESRDKSSERDIKVLSDDDDSNVQCNNDRNILATESTVSETKETSNQQQARQIYPTPPTPQQQFSSPVPPPIVTPTAHYPLPTPPPSSQYQDKQMHTVEMTTLDAQASIRSGIEAQQQQQQNEQHQQQKMSQFPHLQGSQTYGHYTGTPDVQAVASYPPPCPPSVTSYDPAAYPQNPQQPANSANISASGSLPTAQDNLQASQMHKSPAMGSAPGYPYSHNDGSSGQPGQPYQMGMSVGMGAGGMRIGHQGNYTMMPYPKYGQAFNLTPYNQQIGYTSYYPQVPVLQTMQQPQQQSDLRSSVPQGLPMQASQPVKVLVQNTLPHTGITPHPVDMSKAAMQQGFTAYSVMQGGEGMAGPRMAMQGAPPGIQHTQIQMAPMTGNAIGQLIPQRHPIPSQQQNTEFTSRTGVVTQISQNPSVVQQAAPAPSEMSKTATGVSISTQLSLPVQDCKTKTDTKDWPSKAAAPPQKLTQNKATKSEKAPLKGDKSDSDNNDSDYVILNLDSIKKDGGCGTRESTSPAYSSQAMPATVPRTKLERASPVPPMGRPSIATGHQAWSAASNSAPRSHLASSKAPPNQMQRPQHYDPRTSWPGHSNMTQSHTMAGGPRAQRYVRPEQHGAAGKYEHQKAGGHVRYSQPGGPTYQSQPSSVVRPHAQSASQVSSSVSAPSQHGHTGPPMRPMMAQPTTTVRPPQGYEGNVVRSVSGHQQTVPRPALAQAQGQTGAIRPQQNQSSQPTQNQEFSGVRPTRTQETRRMRSSEGLSAASTMTTSVNNESGSMTKPVQCQTGTTRPGAVVRPTHCATQPPRATVPPQQVRPFSHKPDARPRAPHLEHRPRTPQQDPRQRTPQQDPIPKTPLQDPLPRLPNQDPRPRTPNPDPRPRTPQDTRPHTSREATSTSCPPQQDVQLRAGHSSLRSAPPQPDHRSRVPPQCTPGSAAKHSTPPPHNIRPQSSQIDSRSVVSQPDSRSRAMPHDAKSDKGQIEKAVEKPNKTVSESASPSATKLKSLPGRTGVPDSTSSLTTKPKGLSGRIGVNTAGARQSPDQSKSCEGQESVSVRESNLERVSRPLSASSGCSSPACASNSPSPHRRSPSASPRQCVPVTVPDPRQCVPATVPTGCQIRPSPAHTSIPSRHNQTSQVPQPAHSQKSQSTYGSSPRLYNLPPQGIRPLHSHSPQKPEQTATDSPTKSAPGHFPVRSPGSVTPPRQPLPAGRHAMPQMAAMHALHGIRQIRTPDRNMQRAEPANPRRRRNKKNDDMLESQGNQCLLDCHRGGGKQAVMLKEPPIAIKSQPEQTKAATGGKRSNATTASKDNKAVTGSKRSHSVSAHKDEPPSKQCLIVPSSSALLSKSPRVVKDKPSKSKSSARQTTSKSTLQAGKDPQKNKSTCPLGKNVTGNAGKNVTSHAGKGVMTQAGKGADKPPAKSFTASVKSSTTSAKSSTSVKATPTPTKPAPSRKNSRSNSASNKGGEKLIYKGNFSMKKTEKTVPSSLILPVKSSSSQKAAPEKSPNVIKPSSTTAGKTRVPSAAASSLHISVPSITKGRSGSAAGGQSHQGGASGNAKSKLSPGASKRLPKHGWHWKGSTELKPVYMQVDTPPVERKCYESMCHDDGDVVTARDCVLVKSGPRKKDIPYVAKITALWENPDTGEMMMSILWFYRPEHTETERLPQCIPTEVFASRHCDVVAVACIEDKCHVLPFNHYCRYKAEQRRSDQGSRLRTTIIPSEEFIEQNGRHMPSVNADPETVFLCRRVYDLKCRRVLKNPVIHITANPAHSKSSPSERKSSSPSRCISGDDSPLLLGRGRRASNLTNTARLLAEVASLTTKAVNLPSTLSMSPSQMNMGVVTQSTDQMSPIDVVSLPDSQLMPQNTITQLFPPHLDICHSTFDSHSNLPSSSDVIPVTINIPSTAEVMAPSTSQTPCASHQSFPDAIHTSTTTESTSASHKALPGAIHASTTREITTSDVTSGTTLSDTASMSLLSSARDDITGVSSTSASAVPVICNVSSATQSDVMLPDEVVDLTLEESVTPTEDVSPLITKSSSEEIHHISSSDGKHTSNEAQQQIQMNAGKSTGHTEREALTSTASVSERVENLACSSGAKNDSLSETLVSGNLFKLSTPAEKLAEKSQTESPDSPSESPQTQINTDEFGQPSECTVSQSTSGSVGPGSVNTADESRSVSVKVTTAGSMGSPFSDAAKPSTTASSQKDIKENISTEDSNKCSIIGSSDASFSDDSTSPCTTTSHLESEFVASTPTVHTAMQIPDTSEPVAEKVLADTVQAAKQIPHISEVAADKAIQEEELSSTDAPFSVITDQPTVSSPTLVSLTTLQSPSTESKVIRSASVHSVSQSLKPCSSSDSGDNSDPVIDLCDSGASSPEPKKTDNMATTVSSIVSEKSMSDGTESCNGSVSALKTKETDATVSEEITIKEPEHVPAVGEDSRSKLMEKDDDSQEKTNTSAEKETAENDTSLEHLTLVEKNISKTDVPSTEQLSGSDLSVDSEKAAEDNVCQETMTALKLNICPPPASAGDANEPEKTISPEEYHSLQQSEDTAEIIPPQVGNDEGEMSKISGPMTDRSDIIDTEGTVEAHACEQLAIAGEATVYQQISSDDESDVSDDAIDVSDEPMIVDEDSSTEQSKHTSKATPEQSTASMDKDKDSVINISDAESSSGEQTEACEESQGKCTSNENNLAEESICEKSTEKVDGSQIPTVHDPEKAADATANKRAKTAAAVNAYQNDSPKDTAAALDTLSVTTNQPEDNIKVESSASNVEKKGGCDVVMSSTDEVGGEVNNILTEIKDQVDSVTDFEVRECGTQAEELSTEEVVFASICHEGKEDQTIKPLVSSVDVSDGKEEDEKVDSSADKISLENNVDQTKEQIKQQTQCSVNESDNRWESEKADSSADKILSEINEKQTNEQTMEPAVISVDEVKEEDEKESSSAGCIVSESVETKEQIEEPETSTLNMSDEVKGEDEKEESSADDISREITNEPEMSSVNVSDEVKYEEEKVDSHADSISGECKEDQTKEQIKEPEMSSVDLLDEVESEDGNVESKSDCISSKEDQPKEQQKEPEMSSVDMPDDVESEDGKVESKVDSILSENDQPKEQIKEPEMSSVDLPDEVESEDGEAESKVDNIPTESEETKEPEKTSPNISDDVKSDFEKEGNSTEGIPSGSEITKESEMSGVNVPDEVKGENEKAEKVASDSDKDQMKSPLSHDIGGDFESVAGLECSTQQEKLCTEPPVYDNISSESEEDQTMEPVMSSVQVSDEIKDNNDKTDCSDECMVIDTDQDQIDKLQMSSGNVPHEIKGDDVVGFERSECSTEREKPYTEPVVYDNITSESEDDQTMEPAVSSVSVEVKCDDQEADSSANVMRSKDTDDTVFSDDKTLHTQSEQASERADDTAFINDKTPHTLSEQASETNTEQENKLQVTASESHCESHVQSVIAELEKEMPCLDESLTLSSSGGAMFLDTTDTNFPTSEMNTSDDEIAIAMQEAVQVLADIVSSSTNSINIRCDTESVSHVLSPPAEQTGDVILAASPPVDDQQMVSKESSPDRQGHSNVTAANMSTSDDQHKTQDGPALADKTHTNYDSSDHTQTVSTTEESETVYKENTTDTVSLLDDVGLPLDLEHISVAVVSSEEAPAGACDASEQIACDDKHEAKTDKDTLAECSSLLDAANLTREAGDSGVFTSTDSHTAPAQLPPAAPNPTIPTSTNCDTPDQTNSSSSLPFPRC